jgi:hypothetical protein
VLAHVALVRAALQQKSLPLLGSEDFRMHPVAERGAGAPSWLVCQLCVACRAHEASRRDFLVLSNCL